MDKSALYTFCSHCLNWWWTGLKAWLPENGVLQPQQERQIRVSIADEQISLRVVERSGKVQDSQVIALGDESTAKQLENWLKRYAKLKCGIVLSPDQYLVRQLKLPGSARNNLDNIIRFEIERQTPFFADQTFSGYQVKQDSSAEKKLLVKLAVLPKKIAQQLQATLGALGLTVDLYLTSDSEKEQVRISAGEKAGSSSEYERMTGWLLLLSFTFFMIWLYQPVIHYEEAAESLSPTVSAAKEKAKQTIELQQRNTALEAKVALVDKAVTSYLSPLQYLSRLTELLPDDSWIEHCEIQNNHVRLRGYSGSVTALTAALNTAEEFGEVRLNQSGNYPSRQGKQFVDIDAAVLIQEINDDV